MKWAWILSPLHMVTRVAISEFMILAEHDRGMRQRGQMQVSINHITRIRIKDFEPILFPNLLP